MPHRTYLQNPIIYKLVSHVFKIRAVLTESSRGRITWVRKSLGLGHSGIAGSFPQWSQLWDGWCSPLWLCPHTDHLAPRWSSLGPGLLAQLLESFQIHGSHMVLGIPQTGGSQCSKSKLVCALNSHVSNTHYSALF